MPGLRAVKPVPDSANGLRWKADTPPNLVRGKLKRRLLLLLGWVFVVLGVAGLFLPFLQGMLFLLAGLTILSSEYPWARKLMQRLKERFPSLSMRLDAARQRTRSWLKRILPAKFDGKTD